MPLLGWPLVALLVVVLILAMAATLLLWPRVRGGRVLRDVQRLGLVLVSQLAAVLLLAAAVNNYGYFYGSWSDLFGTASPSAAVTTRWPSGHFGKTGAVTTTSVVADQPQWSSATEYATRGRVEDIRIRGLRSGISQDAMVYLPPQYFQAAYAHHQFPAIEVMSGYPGITTTLVSRMHYPDVLLNEILQHRARPMVLVMLRPTVDAPRDTECTDVPGGPLAMTFLAQDVPLAIDNLLRVRPLGWGVMGDSTGGYCAVKEAMTHSDIFSSAVSFSGYYHALQDMTTGDLWGGSSVLRNLNSPEWLLAHQPAPPISVLTTIGTSEGGSSGLGDTRKFLSLVRPPMSVSSVLIPRGGHNFASWGRAMPMALDWLSHKLGA
jgi:enterochelin esterase-like enzyme